MIEVHDLVKRYRYRGKVKTAVLDLSFSLNDGRSLGVLGPNGAGKSTTMRILATLMKPDSGGQRRRVDIAMGLVNNPSAAFLDEPSAGLDPDAREDLCNLLLSVRKQFGTSIVITTHYIEEAERVADNIMVMDKGSIVSEGSPQQLSNQYAQDTITLAIKNARKDDLSSIFSAMSAIDESLLLNEDDSICNVQIKALHSPKVLPDILREMNRIGAEITSIDVRQGSLNDAFLRLTGNEATP
ncbi:ATP-binding cassette domain-containing protein [Bifidobacterium aquikefiricola]|uniref:ABC transporter ATP-binding protein n=1 Tax=Bifidobacterium aquikefiricola TaxID=3059038 RepID=A0AB39U805_9BIFI